jgi:hypothetical protein
MKSDKEVKNVYGMPNNVFENYLNDVVYMASNFELAKAVEEFIETNGFAFQTFSDAMARYAYTRNEIADGKYSEWNISVEIMSVDVGKLAEF